MKSDNLAGDIMRRAYSLNISITELCRQAGVSRRWFEYFKQRTPQAVDTYIRIISRLEALEKSRGGGLNG